jgi:hypothetical protein
MVPTPPAYRLFVGIDVAATTCAVAWMQLTTLPSRPVSIDQTPAGFASHQRQLQAIEPDPQAPLASLSCHCVSFPLPGPLNANTKPSLSRPADGQAGFSVGLCSYRQRV